MGPGPAQHRRGAPGTLRAPPRRVSGLGAALRWKRESHSKTDFSFTFYYLLLVFYIYYYFKLASYQKKKNQRSYRNSTGVRKKKKKKIPRSSGSLFLWFSGGSGGCNWGHRRFCVWGREGWGQEDRRTGASPSAPAPSTALWARPSAPRHGQHSPRLAPVRPAPGWPQQSACRCGRGHRCGRCRRCPARQAAAGGER